MQRYLPSSIVHGFTLGVAIIIASSQLSSALGIRDVPARSSCFLNIVETLSRTATSDVWAASVCAFMWMSLFALIKVQPRLPWYVVIAAVGIAWGSAHNLRYILIEEAPGMLQARLHLRLFWLTRSPSLYSTCFSYISSAFGYLPHLFTLGDKYGTLQAILWSPINPSTLHRITNNPQDICLASVSIAFVAVLESLISGKLAADWTHIEMDSGREVLALGVANLVGGVAGGLPATAALARTSLSVRSGATGRMAGVVSASLTGVLAVALLPAFSYLPLCVVAALLFQVAVGMLDSVSEHLVDAYKVDATAFRLTLLVAVLCVVFDPTAAILVGSILGLVSQAARSTAGYAEVITSDDDSRRNSTSLQHFDGSSLLIPPTLAQQPQLYPIALYRFVGDLSFLSAVRHVERLRQLHHSYCLVLSFRFCRSVDLDGLHQLHRYLDEAETSSAGSEPSIVMCSAHDPHVQASLSASGWFGRWQQAGRVFDNVAQAIDALSGEVAEADGIRLRAKMMQAKGQRGSISVMSLTGAV